MNRVSWDTKRARRPAGERRPQPRPDEMRLVEASAELIRAAWARPNRNPF
jgi:hypothetical protein